MVPTMFLQAAKRNFNKYASRASLFEPPEARRNFYRHLLKISDKLDSFTHTSYEAR